MKRAWIWAIGLLVTPLQSCGSGPPAAPLGFDRHPANSPATLAGLNESAEPPARLPVPSEVASAVPANRPAQRVTRDLGPTPNRITVFIVSDFNAPAGISSLTPQRRGELVAAAASAQSVTLLCRGDQSRASRSHWQALIRRGMAVKRFLIDQGIQASRIRLLARSSGAFIADNATADGRAQNRRVEIHLK
jgi:hypothetical protein